jgi:hypothetical protein
LRYDLVEVKDPDSVTSLAPASPSPPHPQSYVPSSALQSNSSFPNRTLTRLWTEHNQTEAAFLELVCQGRLEPRIEEGQ